MLEMPDVANDCIMPWAALANLPIKLSSSSCCTLLAGDTAATVAASSTAVVLTMACAEAVASLRAKGWLESAV